MRKEKIMLKLKTTLVFSLSLLFCGHACAQESESVVFSHPTPAVSSHVKFSSNCDDFKWTIEFSQSERTVKGKITVTHNENILDSINLNNSILQNYSHLEMPGVTCLSRDKNGGLFAKSDMLLLGVDKTGDNTEFLTQISVDESLQIEVISD